MTIASVSTRCSTISRRPYCSRRSGRADLGTDRVFSLALLKLVEIVCEAGTRVSESVKTEHSEIPWRAIVGTRHHLIHGYDDVDCDILWNIATVDFPPLATQLRTILQTRGWA